MARYAAIPAALSLALAVSAPVRAADLEFFTGESLSAQCAAKPGEADFAAKQGREHDDEHIVGGGTGAHAALLLALAPPGRRSGGL